MALRLLQRWPDHQFCSTDLLHNLPCWQELRGVRSRSPLRCWKLLSQRCHSLHTVPRWHIWLHHWPQHLSLHWPLHCFPWQLLPCRQHCCCWHCLRAGRQLLCWRCSSINALCPWVLLRCRRECRNAVPCWHFWLHLWPQHLFLQWPLHLCPRAVLPCRQHCSCWRSLPCGKHLCWRCSSACSLRSGLILHCWRERRHAVPHWHLWLHNWPQQLCLQWPLRCSPWLLLRSRQHCLLPWYCLHCRQLLCRRQQRPCLPGCSAGPA